MASFDNEGRKILNFQTDCQPLWTPYSRQNGADLVPCGALRDARASFHRDEWNRLL